MRSNGQGRVGFMADGRRLNVALTRARQGMITVGDDLTLRAGSKHWAAYLDWLSSQGAVFGDCSGLVRDDEYRKRKRKKEREREREQKREANKGRHMDNGCDYTSCQL